MSFDVETTLPVVLPVAGAVLSYVFKTVYGILEDRRKSKLERVTEQIKRLYGPLYALNNTDSVAWDAFVRENPGGTEAIAKAGRLHVFRRWMREVFWPLNVARRQVILENYDLIEGHDLEMFQFYMGYVESYRVVLREWEEGDYSRTSPAVRWDASTWGDAYLHHVASTHQRLRAEQERLLSARALLPWGGTGGGAAEKKHAGKPGWTAKVADVTGIQGDMLV